LHGHIPAGLYDQGEYWTFPFFIGHAKLAAEKLSELFGHSQSQAGVAVFARRTSICLGEDVKYYAQSVFRDTDTRILNMRVAGPPTGETRIKGSVGLEDLYIFSVKALYRCLHPHLNSLGQAGCLYRLMRGRKTASR